MNNRTFRFECGKVADYWGDQMPMMVMEEAGELIQALSKFKRVGENPDSKECQNLIDEIGDMTIALKALELHYWKLKGKKTIETLVNERIEKKLSKKYEEKENDVYDDYDDAYYYV